MSLTPAMIDAMVATGCSVEQMAAIMKAALSDTASKSAEKREKDAERQRKSRSNRGLSRGVTVTRCDERDAPNDIYSNPQDIPLDDDKSSSSPKPRKRKSDAGGPMPADWQPVLTEAAQRLVDGWPPGWFVARLAEFRDHASDKGRKSKDWQAAFRAWLTKADEWGRQRNERTNQNRPAPDEIRDPMARVVAAREAERACGRKAEPVGHAGDWP